MKLTVILSIYFPFEEKLDSGDRKTLRNKVKCRGSFTPKIFSFAPLIFDNSTAHWVSLELNLFVLWLYPVLCTLNLQIISQIFTPRPWYLQSKGILHGHLFLDCFLLVYLYYFESWITTQFGSWIIKARYSWWNKFKKPENGKDYAFMIEAVAVYVKKILRDVFGHREFPTYKMCCYFWLIDLKISWTSPIWASSSFP